MAKNLSKAIGYDLGLEGLNTLICGWLKCRKYGHKYRDKLYHRDWLFITEVHDLSDYAGYDLSKI